MAGYHILEGRKTPTGLLIREPDYYHTCGQAPTKGPNSRCLGLNKKYINGPIASEGRVENGEEGRTGEEGAP